MKYLCLCSMLAVGFGVLFQVPAGQLTPPRFDFQHGDRIWIVGDTFAERELHFGYFEALLQAKFPDRKLTLRNLAWSADTPAYQPRPYQFEDMYREVTARPAEVVFLCFGMSASFEGEAGLPRFEDGLLQQIRSHRRGGKTRVVVVSPSAHEKLGPDLPNPRAHNEQLRKYTEAARQLAVLEKVHFIDLFTPTLALMQEPGGSPLTSNGIHPSQYGYWAIAQLMMERLGRENRYEPLLHRAMEVSADPDLTPFFRQLPAPPPPAGAKIHPSLLKKQPLLKVTQLKPGQHTLKMDGKAYLVAEAKEFAAGVHLLRSPAHDAAEDLRLGIVSRNQQFFLRWRAVNGEYIYGRRKTPFGVVNFPGEMKLRDQIIARAERIIHEAAQPVQVVVGIEPGASKLYSVTRLAPDLTPSTEVYDQKQGFIGGKLFPTAADPNEALKHFKMAEGYEISLWASEKDFPLEGPVAMAFDTRGRLWVATMPSYPHDLPGVPPNDKLLILKDSQGKGRADSCTVFADRLYLPTGFEFSHNGVLVAQEPNLVLLRDTDGDDKADTREIVLHGFGTGDSHHAMHAFQWGPDGGLYFGEGTFHRSMVESPHGPVRLFDAGFFRYEPLREKVEVFVSYPFANPWGHIFDRWGQNFIADASGGANYFGLPLTGQVEHPRQHPPMKTFTTQVRPTCGCEIVSSRHFPDDIQGDFLINNCIGFQGIKRHRIIEEGSGYTSKEMPPLLFSTDTSFRPVAICFGPDGALYIADWYNPLVGHMQHSIRDKGRDHIHGRIYRITAKNRPLLKAPKIHGEPLPKLLDLLKSYEDRTRYRVRQEIRTRDKKEVEKAVIDWAGALDRKDQHYEHHLLEALWALQTRNIINTTLLDALLVAKEPRARAAAVRAARFWRDQVPKVRDVFSVLVEDPHPRVRLEAVIALSFLKEPQAAEWALQILRQPMDYYLHYGLKETMTTLEPYWRPVLASGKPFAAGNPAGLEYVIASVGTADLVKMARSSAVYHALLSREHVPEKFRLEALEGLAKLNKTDLLAEAFLAIERVDGSDNPTATHVLGDLTHVLATRPAADLARVRPKLEALAQQARRPITRQVAFTALMTVDNSLARSYDLANRSIPTLVDWLEAVSILPDAKLRAAAHAKVQPLLQGLPPHLVGSVKAQKSPLGRYVRLELPGTTRTLTLAEVEVFSRGSNIARRGRASQSTTAHGGEAARGIDGNKSGVYADGGQTHTAENAQYPWWEVDLGRAQPIEAIEVWNRTENKGAYASRLEKFRMIVLDEKRQEVWKKENNPAPAQSVRFELGLDPVALVRRAAMSAVTRLPGHEATAFGTLAALVKADDLRDDAIHALRSLPRQQWPTDQVRPLVQSLIGLVEKVPANQRTAPEVLEALQLANDLTTALPAEQAKELRGQLGEVGVSVVFLRTQPHRMAYDRTRFYAEAGKPVVLVLENNDIMPHNLLITRPGALTEIGMAADQMAQDPEAFKLHFVPKNDKVLHATRLLQPRESQRLEFLAPKEPGLYPYLCTFPGHWRVMNGLLHVVPKLSEVPPGEQEPALLPASLQVRPFVRAWTFAELLPELIHLDRGRSFERGQLLFKETTCLQCHKIGKEGGNVGPNLCDVQNKLTSRKWTRADLLREVIEPSQVIDEKFATWNIETASGALVSGLIVAEDKKKVTVLVNPLAPPVEVKVGDIELRTRAKVSMMPPGLLNTLERDEILDLLAYILAGGEARHPAFVGGASLPLRKEGHGH